MLQQIEGYMVFSPFEKQIVRDIQNGVMTTDEARDLVARMRAMHAYARLQLCLYGMLIAKRIVRTTPPGTELVASNAIIEAAAIINHRTAFRPLHAPGMLILRMIPGLCSCVGTLAILKAEPMLYGVSLRLCEYAYTKLRLRFLIPIFVRPVMKALRWLYELEWPCQPV